MPAYTNFTTAWTSWRNNFAGMKASMTNFESYLTLAIGATTWQTARNYICTALTYFRNAFGGHTSYGSLDYTWADHYMATYYAWTEAPPAVINMNAILNAMLAANFDELQKFIGIEDAYRVALWNAPFNADFYAALARGFTKWT